MEKSLIIMTPVLTFLIIFLWHRFIGSVFLGYHRPTFKKLALKFIPKNGPNLSLESEVQIMKKLNHPNIIKLVKAFDTEKCFIIAMELASGKDLFSYVSFYLQY